MEAKENIIKIIVLIAVFFISKDIIPALLFPLTGIPEKWSPVFDFTIFFICTCLTVLFLFKFSLKELSEYTGIKKEGFLLGLLVCVIFVCISVVGCYLANPETFSESLGQYFFMLEEPHPFTELLDSPILLIPFLYFLLFASTIEDIAFRGVLVAAIEGDSKSIPRTIMAVVISALVFSLWHMDLYSAPLGQMFFLFLVRLLMGIIFSIIFFLSKRNIFGVGLFHGITNVWLAASGGILNLIAIALGLPPQ